MKPNRPAQNEKGTATRYSKIQFGCGRLRGHRKHSKSGEEHLYSRAPSLKKNWKLFKLQRGTLLYNLRKVAGHMPNVPPCSYVNGKFPKQTPDDSCVLFTRELKIYRKKIRIEWPYFDKLPFDHTTYTNISIFSRAQYNKNSVNRRNK